MDTDLKLAFERYEQLPFPEDSDDEAVSELHDELAQYDGFIAGLILTVLEGGQVEAGQLRPDTALRERLEQIVRKGSTQGAADARTYLEQLARLEQLMELARRRVTL